MQIVPANEELTHKRPPLLVVDDEPGFHESVAHYFGPMWELHSAFNVPQGRTASQSRRFAGAIVDLNMPGGTAFTKDNPFGGGFEVARALRHAQPDCPVVIMTGLILPWIADASFRIGTRLLSKSDFHITLPQLSTWFLARARGESSAVAESVTRFVERHKLSRRYLDVLNAALEDPTRKGISERLAISPMTIRDYTRRLIRLAKVQTLQELLTQLRQGIVPPVD